MSRSRIDRSVSLIFSIALIISSYTCTWAGWRSERPLAPNVQHIFIRKDSGPWEINIVKAKRSDARLSLRTELASGEVLNNAPLSAIVKSASDDSHFPVVAINGDFFRMDNDVYAGTPIGLQITNGELITFPYKARSSVLIDSNGQLSIQRTRVIAAATANKIPFTIHGSNSPRAADQLILYTPNFGDSTLTNSAGVEAILETSRTTLPVNADFSGTIRKISRAGNSTIPRDGMVISGNGEAARFLENLRVGDSINITIALKTTAYGTPPASQAASADPNTPVVAERPILPPQIVEAVGGGPLLVHEGKIDIAGDEESFTPAFINTRHPRSAIGLSADSLFLVTVDGRQGDKSQGMSLQELAKLMLDLGCKEALNLDGGGSTEMIARDNILNSPSGGGERRIANALILFSREPVNMITALAMAPAPFAMLPDERVQLRLSGCDLSLQRVEINSTQIAWTVTPQIGVVSANGVFTINTIIDKPQTVQIEARLGELSAKVTAKIYPYPSSLVIAPERLTLNTGQTQQFIVEGRSADGSLIPAVLLRPQWSCTPEIGQIGLLGYFRAAGQSATGTITAQVGTATTSAQVIINGGGSAVTESDNGTKQQ
jgi:hypothetical protein